MWEKIVETLSTISEQLHFLMNRGKVGICKFDIVFCMIFQHLDSNESTFFNTPQF
jgi:hypothetical protein